MGKFSQKPGFLEFLEFVCGESETGFLSKISVRMGKFSQKPGFLDFGFLKII